MSYVDLLKIFTAADTDAQRLATIDVYNAARSEEGNHDSVLDTGSVCGFELGGQEPMAAEEVDRDTEYQIAYQTGAIFDPRDDQEEEVDEDSLTEAERVGIESY